MSHTGVTLAQEAYRLISLSPYSVLPAVCSGHNQSRLWESAVSHGRKDRFGYVKSRPQN